MFEANDPDTLGTLSRTPPGQEKRGTRCYDWNRCQDNPAHMIRQGREGARAETTLARGVATEPGERMPSLPTCQEGESETAVTTRVTRTGSAG